MADYAASGDYTREFIGAALITLLWTETNPDSETGDKALLDTYGTEDIAPASRASFEEECRGFLSLVEEEIEGDPFADIRPDTMGHLFVLSKNGHGAGFWDAGLGERGDALHKWAKTYGESMAYVGNDGKVWIA